MYKENKKTLQRTVCRWRSQAAVWPAAHGGDAGRGNNLLIRCTFCNWLADGVGSSVTKTQISDELDSG